jgi:hypothetical protein
VWAEIKHNFWTKVVSHFDSDGNGRISRLEFGAILVRSRFGRPVVHAR